ncbi:MAG: hypothetical protein ACE361_25455 [Aureliella sp.]
MRTQFRLQSETGAAALLRIGVVALLASFQCSESFGQVPARFATYSKPVTQTAASQNGPNNGLLRNYGELQVETLLSDAGIRVFLTRSGTQPLSTRDARGVALIKVAGEAKRFRFDLLPNSEGVLEANTNLARMQGKQVEVEVLLVSLPNQFARRGTLKYRDVITIAPNASQLAASAVARQGICPVSGRRLGSMGDPVAVSVAGKTIYACCESCVKAITNDPQKYAAGKPTILVSTATAEDAAAIAMQKVCPVMDEPLGGMGQPIKVMVGDKPIYLCCKGCIKRIEAEPRKYLDMVYGQIAGETPLPTISASLQQNNTGTATANAKQVALDTKEVRPGIYQVSEQDQQFISAQKRCPVMDEPLDAMGGPYKVNAAGKAIYICCPGCAKRIAADPGKYLNILAKQGVAAPVIR